MLSVRIQDIQSFVDPFIIDATIRKGQTTRTKQIIKVMKRKNAIFLKPFTIKNPTLEEQNAYMLSQIINEVESGELGEIFSNDDLFGKDITEFISGKVNELQPEWIIAEGKCATAVLKMKLRKKVLINPAVTTEDLNNVSEQERCNTFGFFDRRHEEDYGRFQSVYPHAAWFPQEDNLSLFTIKGIVQEIVKG